VKVKEILHRLQDADLDAVVLWLAPYADASDAEEICDVTLVTEPWTCERHRWEDGRVDDIHHPTAGGLSVGWDQANDEQRLEQVVILSSVQRA
jgi:hypothetical protein